MVKDYAGLSAYLHAIRFYYLAPLPVSIQTLYLEYLNLFVH